MSDTRALGAWGEDLAARHLEGAGLVVLDRNWRCREGEIDIVARDGDAIVICEVKTRRGQAFGSPAEAVTPGKLRRLRLLAIRWMAASGTRAATIRFDVVAVLVSGTVVTVDHVVGVGA